MDFETAVLRLTTGLAMASVMFLVAVLVHLAVANTARMAVLLAVVVAAAVFCYMLGAATLNIFGWE